MATTDNPALPLDDTAARELLMEAALTISSFNRKLSAAGFPFQPPPNVTRIISEIDMLLDPPPPRKVSNQKQVQRVA